MIKNVFQLICYLEWLCSDIRTLNFFAKYRLKKIVDFYQNFRNWIILDNFNFMNLEIIIARKEEDMIFSVNLLTLPIPTSSHPDYCPLTISLITIICKFSFSTKVRPSLKKSNVFWNSVLRTLNGSVLVGHAIVFCCVRGAPGAALSEGMDGKQ